MNIVAVPWWCCVQCNRQTIQIILIWTVACMIHILIILICNVAYTTISNMRMYWFFSYYLNARIHRHLCVVDHVEEWYRMCIYLHNYTLMSQGVHQNKRLIDHSILICWCTGVLIGFTVYTNESNCIVWVSFYLPK